MLTQALASGSKGNSIYVETEDCRILFDQGLSARQLVLRLNESGHDPENLDALFITHEHTDHVKGVRVLAKKYNIPVYVSAGTREALDDKGLLNDVPRIHSFQPGHEISINSTRIHSFGISHDAREPVNYIIESSDIRTGIFTDLGHVSHLVRQLAGTCSYLYLEANHDVEMLRNGSYPLELQRRIRSRFGHLSNHQSLELLENLLPSPELQGISFIHLSEENNRPALLEEQVRGILEKTGRTLPFEICLQHEISHRQQINKRG